MARLTVADLIERIGLKINRIDMGENFILSIFNQCNVDIASRINFKELATVSEVTFATGENSVLLPSDFHKNLDYGKNITTGRNLTVKYSRRVVDRIIGKMGKSGNVFIIANDYPDIYYQYSPLSDQIGQIYYHGLPTDLTLRSEFPAYIPSGFVFRIYYNYTLSQMYDVIEDGAEGEKVNTLHHMDHYEKAMEELTLFIGPDPDVPDNLSKYNQSFDFDY